MPEWTLYVRNSDRTRVAEVDDFQQFEMRLRFNRVGSWVLDVNADLDVAAEFTFGRGIVAVRDGTTVMSGPITRLERKRDGDVNRLIVSGADDNVWLARGLAYPEAPALTTATDAYDVRTGVASTVMREYVDSNVGPSADSSRKVAGLTLASDPTVGTSVTGRGRFHQLDELLRKLAVDGGDLGFNVLQSGTDLEFDVYEPQDRSSSAIFSLELGNLRGFTYSQDAPEANFLVVGGGGEGVLRTFVTGGDSGSISTHGRVEQFVDQRNSTDVTELRQERDGQLVEKASRSALSIDPVDTDALAYLTGYSLGDKVTVVVDGVPIVDVIREVHIVLDSDGETLEPVVGTPGESDPRSARLFEMFASVRRRVGNLERR